MNNNTYFICDVGNAYTKAIYNSVQITFPSRMGSSLFLNSSQVILTANGMSYAVGSGIYDIQTEKINRNDTINYILASVAKASNIESVSVDYLVLALPLGQYSKYSDKLKSDLEKNKYHSFSFNGVSLTFEYSNVVILPEAIASYYYMRNKIKDISSHDTLIIDVGGGTTDIVSIDINGIASMPKTINVGSIKLLQHIATFIEESYDGIGIVNAEKVESYIKSGFIYNGQVQNLDNALIYAQDDIRYIVQQLNTYYSTQLKTSNVVIIDKLGFLYNMLKNEYPDNKFIYIDDSFANALGMEIMIKSIL